MCDNTVCPSNWQQPVTSRVRAAEALPASTPALPPPSCIQSPPAHDGAVVPGEQAPAPTEPNEATITASASCCARPLLTDGWCPWHHPRVMACVNRPQCHATSSLAKRCRELALEAAASDGATVGFRSVHCWYHMAPSERRAIQAFLTDHQSPTTDIHPLQVTAKHGGAVRHSEVLAMLQLHRTGDLITLEASIPELAWPRSTFLVRLRSPATTATPASAEVLARFCTTCDTWHAPDVPPLSIPTVDATYFSVSDPSPDQRNVASADLSPECIDGDAGSDVDEPTPTPPGQGTDSAMDPLFADAPLPSNATPTAALLRHTFIYPARPPHIHKAAWASISAASRAEHVRWLRALRDSPADIASMPIAQAAIEIVLRRARERQWRWSTIASKLSTVRSALRNLSLHSTTTNGVDLSTDPAFVAAQSYAQRQARLQSLSPIRSRPLSWDEYKKLRHECNSESAPLLLLAWWFAARVGDVRRLHPSNIHLEPSEPDDKGFVALRATFTKGKGAFFWGPYSIHTKLPTAEAKVVYDRVTAALATNCECIATPEEQAHLSRLVSGLPDASLRSIRRGSLCFFASAGATDCQLQLLSGHRRRDTLLRYLGWGLLSSEAAAAATARTDAAAELICGGGCPTPRSRSRWMGSCAGFPTDRGRRGCPPPQLFPHKPPSSRDLTGLPTRIDTQNWPLKVKPWIVPIKMERILELAQSSGPDVGEALRAAVAFAQSPDHLGVTWAPLAPAAIPRTSFTADHWSQMASAGKAIPLRLAPDGLHLIPIIDGCPRAPFRARSACLGFPNPQPAKSALRPVFQPQYNDRIDRAHLALTPLHYPARLQRRVNISRAKYRLQTDFAAFYDQAELDECLWAYHVCRSLPTTIAGEDFSFFALTRVPMGATYSAHLMQTVTWALVAPISRAPLVHVHTMIDNVCIYGDDGPSFIEAVRTFFARCKMFGVQFSPEEDMSDWPDEKLLQAADATQGDAADMTFLGERYVGSKVMNSNKNTEKLQGALTRLQQAVDPHNNVVVTRRQAASIISLCTFMAPTINLQLRCFFGAIRLFSRISQSVGADRDWDAPITVTADMAACIGALAGPLLDNTPVSPIPIPAPSDAQLFDPSSYDAIAIVDASADGLGALVRWRSGEIVEMRKAWTNRIQHSAWAEPIAVKEIATYLRRGGAKDIAIVTDHLAIPAGQRRPVSGNAAFSKAYYLNEAFRALYEGGSAQVFYIEGTSNPADGPSRSCCRGDREWRIRQAPEQVFPGLTGFMHPFSEAHRHTLPWWNV